MKTMQNGALQPYHRPNCKSKFGAHNGVIKMLGGGGVDFVESDVANSATMWWCVLWVGL